MFEKEIQEARELLNEFNRKLQEVRENQGILNENLTIIAEQTNKHTEVLNKHTEVLRILDQRLIKLDKDLFSDENEENAAACGGNGLHPDIEYVDAKGKKYPVTFNEEVQQ
jgi:hypothetical protein